jgi:hypothetical protein
MKGFVIMAASGGGSGEIAEMRDWWGEWGARNGSAAGAWRRDCGCGWLRRATAGAGGCGGDWWG